VARVPDGCCGRGGAARGYVLAGHEVWGVDANPELRADYLRSGASGFGAFDILHVLSRPGSWRSSASSTSARRASGTAR
jgi:hypothetical protein